MRENLGEKRSVRGGKRATALRSPPPFQTTGTGPLHHHTIKLVMSTAHYERCYKCTTSVASVCWERCKILRREACSAEPSHAQLARPQCRYDDSDKFCRQDGRWAHVCGGSCVFAFGTERRNTRERCGGSGTAGARASPQRRTHQLAGA